MKDNMTPLTDVLDFIVDNRGKTVPTSDSGIPLIATNCIKHSSIYPTFDNVRYVNDETMKTWFRAHPKPNDIIFVNKGTPGRVCLVPDAVGFCFAQDMMGFRCDPKKIDYQYLFAVLRSNFIQQKIENFHVGLVIPHFKKGDLGHIKIPRLSSRQLELAVGKLYIELSKKIELNNQINVELEAMAKTLYDYWFVQFDFPDADGKPYKSSGGKMVYNELLKREIPEGWGDCSLGDITELYQPQTISEKEMLDEGRYLVYGANGIVGRYDQYNHEESVVTITCRGNSCGTINFTRPFSWITGNAMVVKPKSVLLVPDYILNLLSSSGVDNVITGSAQPQITRTNLSPLSVINPNQEMLKKYASIATNLFEKRICILEENEMLAKLRDWLLPMLMNGQVTVN